MSSEILNSAHSIKAENQQHYKFITSSPTMSLTLLHTSQLYTTN